MTERNEAHVRAEIVRYCALLWERGLVAGSSGNVSVRLGDGTIVVTPAGRALRDVHADELVRTDAGGVPLAAGARPTSELPLHVAAYRVRPDVQCDAAPELTSGDRAAVSDQRRRRRDPVSVADVRNRAT